MFRRNSLFSRIIPKMQKFLGHLILQFHSFEQNEFVRDEQAGIGEQHVAQDRRSEG